jgi:hypothetical protein
MGGDHPLPGAAQGLPLGLALGGGQALGLVQQGFEGLLFLLDRGLQGLHLFRGVDQDHVLFGPHHIEHVDVELLGGLQAHGRTVDHRVHVAIGGRQAVDAEQGRHQQQGDDHAKGEAELQFDRKAHGLVLGRDRRAGRIRKWG